MPRHRTPRDYGDQVSELAGRGYSGPSARRYVGTATRPREVEPDEDPEDDQLTESKTV